MNIKKIIVIFLLLFLITGCSSKNEIVDKKLEEAKQIYIMH